MLQAVLTAIVSGGAVSTLDLSVAFEPGAMKQVTTRVVTTGAPSIATGTVSVATRPLKLELLTANDFGDADGAR